MSSNELENYNLNDEQKMAIKKSHESLLDKPVNIVSLAKELGVAGVVRRPMSTNRVSGIIEKRDAGYFIVTNEAEPKTRRRFTIAHELAHFLLHREKIKDRMTENNFYMGGLSNRDEVEANRLAADILMPLDKIEELFDREGTALVTLDNLSKTFDVSYSAIKVRLGIPYDGIVD